MARFTGVGAEGDAGVAGPQGPQGPAGETGATGLQGEIGFPGFKYDSRRTLANQYIVGEIIEYQGSYYICIANNDAIAPDEGNIGVYWNQYSFVGAQGLPGESGPQGEVGLTGEQGESGLQGEPGADGFGAGTQVYYNTAQTLLQNSGSQQSLLGLTNGVAVTYGTRYKFKTVATIKVSADNVNLFFAIGGETADQYYRCRYRAIVGKGSYGPGMMPVTIVEVAGAADNQVKNTINIAQGGVGGTYFDVIIEGTVDTRYSGHFKPIILCSPNPGYPGSYVLEGAYTEIYPIGPADSGNSNTSIGNWS